MSSNKSQGFDEQLKTAYEQAIYRIFQPPIHWKIGVLNSAITELLNENNAATAIFITAANPYSQVCSKEENTHYNLLLEKWMEEEQVTYFKGQGEDPQGIWSPEESFLLLDVNAQQGVALGRHWQQNAIVLLEKEKPPTLRWCQPC